MRSSIEVRILFNLRFIKAVLQVGYLRPKENKVQATLL